MIHSTRKWLSQSFPSGINYSSISTSTEATDDESTDRPPNQRCTPGQSWTETAETDAVEAKANSINGVRDAMKQPGASSDPAEDTDLDLARPITVSQAVEFSRFGVLTK